MPEIPSHVHSDEDDDPRPPTNLKTTTGWSCSTVIGHSVNQAAAGSSLKWDKNSARRDRLGMTGRNGEGVRWCGGSTGGGACDAVRGSGRNVCRFRADLIEKKKIEQEG